MKTLRPSEPSLPCPWCHRRTRVVLSPGLGAWVKCAHAGCFATGPCRKTVNGAVRAWNRIVSLALPTQHHTTPILLP